ncbi:MAG: Unknown protein [uncultured Aureispira sp.]|uniref:Uncharacterized protein n=1 Tax=uncultured Aureispira sp. TaxID=1331704 RepID=A0A6S6U5Z4_9BACT|nr:MAG: Unknown protein [uncultured Aureispira sp.]
MKKTFYLILISIISNLAPSFIQAQHVELEWAYSIGTTARDRGYGVSTDLHGNVYTTGFFMAASTDFDPGENILNLPTVFAEDVFIQKFDAQGQLLWAQSYGGPGYDEGRSVATDSFGNVYLLGTFADSIDVDFGPGVHQLYSNGNWDFFILKLDANGNFIWAKSFGGTNYDQGFKIVVDKAQNPCITGYFGTTVDFDPGPGVSNRTVNGGYDIFVLKLDSNGNFVWVSSIGGPQWDEGRSIIIDSFNNIYTQGFFTDSIDLDPSALTDMHYCRGYRDIYIQKLDPNGNLLWGTTYGGIASDEGYGLAVDKHGAIYSTGFFSDTVDFDPSPATQLLISNGSSDTYLQKIDANGNLIWVIQLGSQYLDRGRGVGITSTNEVLLTGTYRGFVDFDPSPAIFSQNNCLSLYDDIYMVKLDSNANFIAANGLRGCGDTDVPTDLAIDNKDNAYVIGYFVNLDDVNSNTGMTFDLNGAFNESGLLFKLYSGNVIGRIYEDLDLDCTIDATEKGLAGRLVEINPGGIIATTGPTGVWNLPSLPIGSYTATVDTSGGWLSSCPISQSFTITNPNVATSISPVGLKKSQICPAPHVSIHAPFLRPGFSNQKIYVNACNLLESTVYLDSAYVVVTLDNQLTVQGSSLPFTSLGNQQYSIFVDTLIYGDCVSFWLDCHLDSTAILGQSLCLSATLLPLDACSLDNTASPYPPMTVSGCSTAYDGSSILLEGECIGDSIRFVIRNEGQNMTCFAPWQLFIDAQIERLDSFQLMAGDSLAFWINADSGRTIRLEAYQHPLHLGASFPSITIEACGSNLQNWTPDLVNLLPLDDANPHHDIFCGVISGSYDPNDKKGFPLGTGIEHNISPNQPLDYVIQFQNTGTDTAYTVVIRDTLASELDIFSVVSGASSHNYSFRIYGPRVLEWRFESILLPDSTTNLDGSQGFVTFQVNQLPNLPSNTILNNQAAIYFDFNLPIFTNTSWHTVDEDFSVFTSIETFSEEENSEPYLLFPNPTMGELFLTQKNPKVIQIKLFDNLGQMVYTQEASDKLVVFNFSHFPSGVYYISINNGSGQTIQKLIKN